MPKPPLLRPGLPWRLHPSRTPAPGAGSARCRLQPVRQESLEHAVGDLAQVFRHYVAGKLRVWTAGRRLEDQAQDLDGRSTGGAGRRRAAETRGPRLVAELEVARERRGAARGGRLRDGRSRGARRGRRRGGGSEHGRGDGSGALGRRQGPGSCGRRRRSRGSHWGRRRRRRRRAGGRRHGLAAGRRGRSLGRAVAGRPRLVAGRRPRQAGISSRRRIAGAASSPKNIRMYLACTGVTLRTAQTSLT